MKTLILLILLIGSHKHLNAQAVYPILKDAYKCIDEYDYNSRVDLKESRNISLKLDKAKKKEYKIISDALIKAGFDFNPVCDTLLFEFVYEDYVIGGCPCDIYAQSSNTIKILTINSYKESTYIETPSQGKLHSRYSMMYFNKIDSFRELYMTAGGKSIGCYTTALRVIIKNGKIVYPSLVWNYGCMLNQ